MSDKTCPKCGAEVDRVWKDADTDWECGSSSYPHGRFWESPGCLRRQVAARDAALRKCIAAIKRLRQDVVLDGGPYCRGWLDAVKAASKAVRKLVKE